MIAAWNTVGTWTAEDGCLGMHLRLRIEEIDVRSRDLLHGLKTLRRKMDSPSTDRDIYLIQEVWQLRVAALIGGKPPQAMSDRVPRVSGVPKSRPFRAVREPDLVVALEIRVSLRPASTCGVQVAASTRLSVASTILWCSRSNAPSSSMYSTSAVVRTPSSCLRSIPGASSGKSLPVRPHAAPSSATQTGRVWKVGVSMAITRPVSDT